ncbi:MAG TPA: hypothetical protein VH115_09155, partial [Solirubrobacteraceae bacterium]|nr:hypothetical protein [Solirubrobacteraceae bacterium]
LAACQDNAPAGPVEIPEHLLVRETMRDCLHEAMDIDGLVRLVRRFEERSVRLHFIDTVEPSVLAHEILNGAPYTYLDEDTEIGERRSRSVPLRRGLPVEPRELGRLEDAAIARVREEARPDVRDPDELHDVLCSLVVVRPRAEWAEHFAALARAGRAFEAHPAGGASAMWAATERHADVEALLPGARRVPDTAPPAALRGGEEADAEDVAIAVVQGHLEISGPVAAEELVEALGISASSVTFALETLRTRGFAIAGRFEDDRGEQWCARRLLARIHAYTRDRRRAQIRPITREQWGEFLAAWWHSTPATRVHGRAGVAEVIEQFQGFEWPAGDWERLFSERVEAYRPEWLDDLCLSGEVAWARLSLVQPVADGEDPAAGEPRRAGRSPSRRTPITFMLREDLRWLLQAHRGGSVPAEPTGGPAQAVLEALRAHGAQFHSELQAVTHRLPTEIEEGLWDGVARGLIAADGFNAVRSLLHARSRFARRQRRQSRAGSRGRRGGWRQGVEGRWTLLPDAASLRDGPPDADELAETVAWQLLLRWGIVCREVYGRERLAVPWRDVLWALRRLEARGLIRGGHFVAGVTGEQFADEQAMTALARVRRGSAAGGDRRSESGQQIGRQALALGA